MTKSFSTTLSTPPKSVALQKSLLQSQLFQQVVSKSLFPFLIITAEQKSD